MYVMPTFKRRDSLLKANEIRPVLEFLKGARRRGVGATPRSGMLSTLAKLAFANSSLFKSAKCFNGEFTSV